MRNRNKRGRISALLAIGFTAGFTAAYAEKTEVSMQEDIVKEGPNKEMAPEWYPEQVERLARLYQEYGRRREAEETYKKTLDLFRKLPGGSARIPTVIMGFAGTLAHFPYGVSNNYPADRNKRIEAEANAKALYAEDLVKAQRVANEAIALIQAKPRPDDQDIYLLFMGINIFQDAGNMARREQVIAILDKILRQKAAEPPQSQWHYSSIGENLNHIAKLYCDDPPDQNLPDGRPVPIFTDNAAHNEYGFSEKNFKISESYRLRAMQLYDKLPAKDEARIEAQRALAYWYKRYGQTCQFDIQAKKLSALLQTTDPTVLYPVRIVCVGCGRG